MSQGLGQKTSGTSATFSPRTETKIVTTETPFQAVPPSGHGIETKITLVTSVDQEHSRDASLSLTEFYDNYVNKISAILKQVNLATVQLLVDDLTFARDNGKRIFIFGNGGSASTASHMATDLAKRREGMTPYKVLSLTDNTSLITATGNDEGYENIFTNQLYNLMEPDDVVIAISSSGNSKNVVDAVCFANENGARTHSVVGFDGGVLQSATQNSVYIPTKKGQYGFHEDVSLILNHIVSIYLLEQAQRL